MEKNYREMKKTESAGFKTRANDTITPMFPRIVSLANYLH